VYEPVKFFLVLQLFLGLGSMVLTSLLSLFYVTGECYRFFHRGWALHRKKCQLRSDFQPPSRSWFPLFKGDKLSTCLRNIRETVNSLKQSDPYLSSRRSASACASLPWSGRSRRRSDTVQWASPCSCCRRTLYGCVSLGERVVQTDCRTRHTWTVAGDHGESWYAWWQWSRAGMTCHT